MILKQAAQGVISDPNYLGGRYLNDVDDAGCGGPVVTMGTGAGYNPGQLGNIIYLNDYWAAKLSNATYTLYAGRYQYVQFKAGSSNSNIVGAPVAWDTFANLGHSKYVVTPDIGSTNYLQLAGIAIKANTKGNYGWIFTGEGLCNVYYKASPTANSIGDLLMAASSVQTFDTLAIGSAVTTGALWMAVTGIAYEAAGVSGSVSRHVAWIF